MVLPIWIGSNLEHNLRFIGFLRRIKDPNFESKSLKKTWLFVAVIAAWSLETEMSFILISLFQSLAYLRPHSCWQWWELRSVLHNLLLRSRGGRDTTTSINLNPVSLPSFNSPHPVFRCGTRVVKSRSPFSLPTKVPWNTKPFNISDSQKGSGRILISFNFFDAIPDKGFPACYHEMEKYYLKIKILGLRNLKSLGLLPVRRPFISSTSTHWSRERRNKL